MAYLSYRKIDLIPSVGEITFSRRNPGWVLAGGDNYKRRVKDYIYEGYLSVSPLVTGSFILGLLSLAHLLSE